MAFRVLSSLTAALGRRLNLRLGTVAALAALDMLLIAASLIALRQNVILRGTIADDVTLLAPPSHSVAPPLAGADWAGNTQTIAYQQDRRPTLVYTFTKLCGHCQQNWRAMRSLQALAPRRVRMVYIDTVDTFTSKYLAANGIGNSVLLVRLAPEAALAYEARLMPQLELLDRDGRVQWSHVGELASGDVVEALSMIEHDQSE